MEGKKVGIFFKFSLLVQSYLNISVEEDSQQVKRLEIQSESHNQIYRRQQIIEECGLIGGLAPLLKMQHFFSSWRIII